MLVRCQLPQREGLQIATIAVWRGKIELTQLDSDAIAAPRPEKAHREGAPVSSTIWAISGDQRLGLPVYSINGGAGYLWSASVDRNYRGHIRASCTRTLYLAAAIRRTSSGPHH